MDPTPPKPEPKNFLDAVADYNWTGFTLLNFAAPIAFFVTFQLAGSKPAIGVAVLSTLIQVAAHGWLRIRFSPFFIVASGFTVGFGLIDLFLATPRFFRLEPAAQNLIMGLVFLVTGVTRIPIAQWFAEGLPEPVRPKLDSHLKSYLRKVTVVWAAYFMLKAVVFYYVALRTDLGRLIIFRSLFGGGTLALMLGGEIAYRKLFMKAPVSLGTPDENGPASGPGAGSGTGQG